MKLLLLFATLLVLVTATEVQQVKQYNWTLDLFLWWFDEFIMLCAAIIWYPFYAFWFNSPAAYTSFVVGLLNTPYLQLSYKYM